jgi:hypothetical protein
MAKARKAKASDRVPVPAAAEALDIATDTVYRDVANGAPHRREGRAIRLDVAEYRAWREERNLTGERGRPKPIESEDMEAVKLIKERGLARIKTVEAERQERRAEVEKGTHQSLDDLREMLVLLGSILKSGVERMQRRFGADAAVMFNETLDEFDGMARKHLASMAGTGGRGAGQAAADAAAVR